MAKNTFHCVNTGEMAAGIHPSVVTVTVDDNTTDYLNSDDITAMKMFFLDLYDCDYVLTDAEQTRRIEQENNLPDLD